MRATLRGGYLEVDRPRRVGRVRGRRRGVTSPMALALLRTAVTGKAVVIPLRGRSARGVRIYLSTLALKHGLRAHVQANKGGTYVVAWAEGEV